jgi:hypothetical protein
MMVGVELTLMVYVCMSVESVPVEMHIFPLLSLVMTGGGLKVREIQYYMPIIISSCSLALYHTRTAHTITRVQMGRS